MVNIRVLVVDDSIFYRELLRKELNKQEGIEVVATAVDPYDAKDKLLKYRPDVMVCDIEMPKMNGLTFIKKVLPQYPIPTIVISSDGAAFDALEAGAVDFVGKTSGDKDNMCEFVNEVAQKILAAKKSRVVIKKKIEMPKVERISTSRLDLTNIEVIAFGASTGGTEALASVLSKLPNTLPGIVIVQHIPPMFSNMFAQRLNKITEFEVKEACNNDEIKRGRILVAPGDKHMKVVKKDGKHFVSVGGEEKVSGHCPSVDILFKSVAISVGKNAIGVIMTGMGADGAKGLKFMANTGSKTIGQDEQSCIVYGMPKEAYKLGAVKKQVSLEDIPKTILEML